MNGSKTESLFRYLKWLYPNLKVKRWFSLAIAGIFIFAAGFFVMTYGLAVGYAEQQIRTIVYRFTGGVQSAALLIGLIFCAAGLLLIIIGFKKMLNSITGCILPANEESIVERMYNRNHLQRGPKIVVVGGGTGLSGLLRGLKHYTHNITAIVTVTDDGGSSGRLRTELGVQPPGDSRNCLVALADTEEVMESVFSYRFACGTLEGHSLGNLLLAGISNISGDFQKGIEQLGKIFAISGKVYPSTLQQVVLTADLDSGAKAYGETAVRDTEGVILRVYLEPEDCRPLPEAVQAIEEADLIVLGPGSLYTSVLPNLLVSGLRDKIRESDAPCVYICNIMTEKGETDNFRVSDHLRAIQNHCGQGFVDAVLTAEGHIEDVVLKRYEAEGSAPVFGDQQETEKLGVRYYEAAIIQADGVVRHDPDRLAKELVRLLFQWKPMSGFLARVDSFLLNRKLSR